MWPFKPRRKPAPDNRQWNEDWCIGDEAECLVDVWMFTGPNDPKKGDVLTVTAIIDGVDDKAIAPIIWGSRQPIHIATNALDSASCAPPAPPKPSALPNRSERKPKHDLASMDRGRIEYHSANPHW